MFGVPNGDNTMFVVSRGPASGAQRIVNLQVDDGTRYSIRYNNGAAGFVNTAATFNEINTPAFDTTQYAVLGARRQAGERELYVSGVSRAYDVGATSVPGITRAYLGAYNGGLPAAGEFLNGDVSEVVIYNRALSDAEKWQVEEYLGGKWGVATARNTVVRTSERWRITSPAPAAGWNTTLAFDDSDAAGWESAFRIGTGSSIWKDSNESSQAPSQVWGRYVFNVEPLPIASVTGHAGFDDDGQVYLNGQLIVNDTGGGATGIDFAIDPALLHPGENLLAMRGIDTIAPFNAMSVALRITYVPEPSTALLLGVGGGIALLARRVRRRDGRLMCCDSRAGGRPAATT